MLAASFIRPQNSCPVQHQGDTRDEASWAARPGLMENSADCGGCGGRTVDLAGGCAERPTQVRSAPLPAHASRRRRGPAVAGAHPAHPHGSGFSRSAPATGVTTVAWSWPGILLTPAVRPTQGTGDGDRLLGDRAQVAADLLVPSPCPARMRLHAEFTVLAHPPRTPARPLLSVIHRASCPPGVLPQNVTPTCSYSSTQPPSSPSQKSPVPSTPSGHAVDKVVAEGGHSRHTSLMRMFLGGFVGASAPPLFYHNKPYEKKRGAAAGVCVLTCASRCKLPENLRRFSLILRHNYHRTCAALTSALCSDGRTSDHALQEVC